MTRWVSVLLFCFTLLGLTTSTVSSYVHSRLIRQPDFVSFCDVSATVSCADVYQSAYGTLAGVPVAVLGVIWFSFVLVLIVTSWRSVSLRENLSGYLFVLSTVALAVSLYLGYASFFVLKAICLLCVGTYIAVLGLFFVSGAAVRFPMTSLPRRARSDLAGLLKTPVAMVAAILLLAAAATTVAFFPREAEPPASSHASTGAANLSQARDQQSEFERWYLNAERHVVPIAREGAKVLVVKFNDYQCPPCRQTYFSYQPILSRYRQARPGIVRYVTLDFPLEPECNVAAPGGNHQAACEAAVAVRLARERLKGLEMEQWLFSNQHTLNVAAVREAARTIAGVSNWDAVYEKMLAGVRADVEVARQLNVKSTPTFFINGVKVEGSIPPPYFDAAIAWELKHAK